jgi:hypothetical protein
LTPSTADSTEIAGVIMLSPKNSAAPKMPSRPASRRSAAAGARPSASLDRPIPSRVISAMMPPSPSLSRAWPADVGDVTMIITDQNTSDTTPNTLSVLTVRVGIGRIEDGLKL